MAVARALGPARCQEPAAPCVPAVLEQWLQTEVAAVAATQTEGTVLWDLLPTALQTQLEEEGSIIREAMRTLEIQ